MKIRGYTITPVEGKRIGKGEVLVHNKDGFFIGKYANVKKVLDIIENLPYIKEKENE